ncbi:MAG: hypothetical protein HPY83_10295 [Anaerolineae bacterium]|nr:hypothetical protein [Anaerolineae bacterium]
MPGLRFRRAALRAQAPSVRLSDAVLPRLAFSLLFLWGWRTPDIVHSIPGMADVLEVLWGVRWYEACLLERGVSPLYSDLIAHPHGWHTATLAHTPFLFLLMLPLSQFAGPALAYNVLAIASSVVAFEGASRVAGRFTESRLAASLVGLVFAFVGMRWFRVSQGHLNVLWLSALLPWLLWALEGARRSRSRAGTCRWLRLSGVIWGLGSCFSLYGLFLGGSCLLIWGREILRPRRMAQAAATALMALSITLPLILLYRAGTEQDGVISLGLSHVLHWGASLNSLVALNVHHPISLLQRVARSIYSGPYDESGMSNLGLVAWAFGALGLWRAMRGRSGGSNLAALAVGGVLLSCGLLLKWNGEAVLLPALRPLNEAIWKLGHLLKPGLFTSGQAQPPFDGGVPLPGFLLTAVVPFWEHGRVMARYAFVGGIGLMVLAAREIETLPRVARYLVALIWLLETLPLPAFGVPVPSAPHPAYAWLLQQERDRSWGIVDVAYPTLMTDPGILYGTSLHGIPTASGGRPYLPGRVRTLHQFLSEDPQALGSPKAGVVLRSYDVRYLLLHLMGEEERWMWDLVVTNPALDPVGCFEPPEGPSPWPHPICIAQVDGAGANGDSPPLDELILLRGWSEPEDWGVWAEGTESSARWLAADRRDYRLGVEAFPLAVPGRSQHVAIEINGKPLTAHRWTDCETWSAEVEVPAELMDKGWNELVLRYGYAARPSDLPESHTDDARLLSVGFVRLELLGDGDQQ